MYPEIIFKIGVNQYYFNTYKVFIILSILTGLALASINLKLKSRDRFYILIGTIIAFIIGARLLNYLINRDFYLENNLSLTVFKAVGFSFYGGILSSILFLILMSQVLKVQLFQITDGLILPFGFSFFIMRMGCFLNGCCYGKITKSPLGIKIPARLYSQSLQLFSQLIRIHPTQLYEGGLALLGVIICFIYRKRFKTPGVLTITYGIYLTGIRWIILYFRHLNYSPCIIYYFYPFLYASLILLGVLVLKGINTDEKELKDLTTSMTSKNI